MSAGPTQDPTQTGSLYPIRPQRFSQNELEDVVGEKQVGLLRLNMLLLSPNLGKDFNNKLNGEWLKLTLMNNFWYSDLNPSGNWVGFQLGMILAWLKQSGSNVVSVGLRDISDFGWAVSEETKRSLALSLSGCSCFSTSQPLSSLC